MMCEYCEGKGEIHNGGDYAIRICNNELEISIYDALDGWSTHNEKIDYCFECGRKLNDEHNK